MTFKIIKQLKMSQVFDVLNKMVKNEEIESFEITRTALRDIFTAFSRFQHVVDRKEKTMVNQVGRLAAINASRYSESSAGDNRMTKFENSYQISDVSSIKESSPSTNDYYQRNSQKLVTKPQPSQKARLLSSQSPNPGKPLI